MEVNTDAAVTMVTSLVTNTTRVYSTLKDVAHGVATNYSETFADNVSGLNKLWITMENLTDNSSSCDNGNASACSQTHPGGFYHIPKYELPVMVIICIVLSFMVLATIIGNVFVIAAIVLERSLQGVSNYLILSLAVTDLLVAVCVMPLSLVYEVSVNWYFGDMVCDFWISFDVLCCTASILHLVAISLDRFWGVSNIDYIRRRNAKQILKMVAVVWLVSVSISIPPLFGWKDGKNPTEHGHCMISQDLGYTVFSTVGAFYCPLVLMVILNFKIYIAARSRIRKKNFPPRHMTAVSTATEKDLKTVGRTSSCSDDDGYTMCNGSVAMAVTTALNEEMKYSQENNNSNTCSNPVDSCQNNVESGCRNNGYLLVPPPQQHQSYTKLTIGHAVDAANDVSCVTHVTEVQESPELGNGNAVHFKIPAKTTENNNHKHDAFRLKKKRREIDRKRKDKLEMKRERKAAKVLGIITGAFIACWLPFFLLAVLAPFCGSHCNIPDGVFSFFLWLGYFNSSLNPILYTIFNPSFRKAFQKIIYGRYRLRR